MFVKIRRVNTSALCCINQERSE